MASALGISRSTLTKWAREGGFRLKDRKAEKRSEAEKIEDQKKRALSYYRAGDIDLANRILKEAEKRESVRRKFETLSTSFHVHHDSVLETVDRFVLRLHGIEPTPMRVAIGASPAQRWAVWEIIPPYYQALRAAGAQMLPFGRVIWPDGRVPDLDLLPPKPHWLPCQPWDEEIDIEIWMAYCGYAIQFLSGVS